jgi:hypothetical protein
VRGEITSRRPAAEISTFTQKNAQARCRYRDGAHELFRRRRDPAQGRKNAPPSHTHVTGAERWLDCTKKATGNQFRNGQGRARAREVFVFRTVETALPKAPWRQ